MKIIYIKKCKIIPASWNARKKGDKNKRKMLRLSIDKNKQQVPIKVRNHPKKKGFYELIFGYDRWYVHKPDESIPCIICNVTELKGRKLSLAENMVRSDWTDIDTERMITETYEIGIREKEWRNIKDMAQKTGLSFQKISENINAYKDRKRLKIRDHEKISSSDLKESRPLKDHPELQKKVLDERLRGELKKGIHAVHKRATELKKSIELKTSNNQEKPITDNKQTLQLTTPVQTTIDKINETNQNKPLSDTQIQPEKQLENSNQPKVETPHQDVETNNLYETTHCYLIVLKLCIPRDVTDSKSDYERRDILSQMKEIGDRIDELLQISEGQSFLPRRFYKGVP